MSYGDAAGTTSTRRHFWMSDTSSQNCMQCAESFSLLRRRHHCRLCGRLLCGDCTPLHLLIPSESLLSSGANSRDNAAAPQRTCSNCARFLQPLQADLRGLLSKANSETLVDRDNAKRYMNLPYSFSLEQEIIKATYSLLNFTHSNAIEGQDRIPRELLRNCKGIAFLTVAKVGFALTAKGGTGLIVARLDDGTWSAPSGIVLSGLGWGLQAGGELTDVMIVLTSKTAVQAFTSRAQFSIGTELAVSIGPVGRTAGTEMTAGEKGASTAFSYSHSKGLFLGVSLEAAVLSSRPDVNRAFYGQDIKPAVLLSGQHERPKAAEPLYRALSEVLTDTEASSSSSSSRRSSTSNMRAIEPPPSSASGGGGGGKEIGFDDAWTTERAERIKANVSAVAQDDESSCKELTAISPRNDSSSAGSTSPHDPDADDQDATYEEVRF